MTGMEVTLEQVGTTIEFLGCTLQDPTGDCPIAVRNPLSKNSTSTPQQTLKMLSPLAPNTQSALKSMVPNDVKKSQHLRMTHTAVLRNLQGYVDLYKAMGYPAAWWEPLFCKCCQKWGLPTSLARDPAE